MTATVSRTLDFATATIHEVLGRRGALPSGIKPVGPGMRVQGRAVTVDCPGGDNLRIHQALYRAAPDDILVVRCGQTHEYGYWGEIMTVAALARGLGGLVIDGCVRDGAQLVEHGFPIFSRGLCIRGTGKDPALPGSVESPIVVGDVTVTPGDLVVGDGDGVVVVPAAEIDGLADACRERETNEARYMAYLRAGATTLELFGLEAPQGGSNV